jgi:DNA-binding response OmpR family regulator
MRILIIEDSDSIRHMLEALVSARADQISGVSNGVEGLDIAFATHPDLVLLDLHLPGIYSGIEVCARLRANPKTRRVPIFVISASDDPHTVNRVMQEGATRFFPKPFSPREILRAIEDVRRAPQALARPATPFGSFSPLKLPTEAPGASSPARPPQTSQPGPPRRESSSGMQAARETSRRPGSDPPKRT